MCAKEGLRSVDVIYRRVAGDFLNPLVFCPDSLLGGQLLGVVTIGAFAFGFSWLLWMGLEKTVGVRVSPRVEQLGQDVAEFGIEAYPEFVLMPEQQEEP